MNVHLEPTGTHETDPFIEEAKTAKANKPRFCEHCGKRLIKQEKPFGKARYNCYTGDKIQRYKIIYICPDWTTNLNHVSPLEWHSSFEYTEVRLIKQRKNS